MQGVILALIYLCPFGTQATACGQATAIEIHTFPVRAARCEEEARGIALAVEANYWAARGTDITVVVGCPRHEP